MTGYTSIMVAADKRIAAVSLEFDELVNALLNNKIS
jgi:hypothetical protein